MGRGGYIATDIALTRLAKVVGDRREASRLLCGALVSGVISARGQPQLEEVDDPSSDDEPSSGIVLEDIGSLSDYEPKFGPMEGIPARFWKDADSRKRASSNFEHGFASTDSDKSKRFAYDAITLAEREVNAFVKLHVQRGTGELAQTPKRARRRHASWEDWVAALATLAHEHQISGDMTETELLDRIEARLTTWGATIKANSTVQTTARKVIDRLKTNHPIAPFQVNDLKKP